MTPTPISGALLMLLCVTAAAQARYSSGRACFADSGGGSTSAGVYRQSASIGSVSIQQAVSSTYSISPGFDDSSSLGAAWREWIGEHFAEPANPADTGLMADPDGDSLSNLVEFAFHLNPVVQDYGIMVAGAGNSGLPLIRPEIVPGTVGGQRLTIEWVRRTSGVVYVIEVSTDLVAWQPASVTEVGKPVIVDEDFVRVKFAETVPFPVGGRRFLRVRINDRRETKDEAWRIWLATHFTDLTNMARIGPTADPDLDSITNLAEFAFNLDPLAAGFHLVAPGNGTSGLPLIRTECLPAVDDPPRLTLEMIRRKDCAIPVIQASGDLITWVPVDLTPLGPPAEVAPGYERVKFADIMSQAESSRRFLRVGVSNSPP